MKKPLEIIMQLVDATTGEPIKEGVVKDYSVIVPLLEAAIKECGVKISVGPRESGKMFLQWGVTLSSPVTMTEEDVASFRSRTTSTTNSADKLADKNVMPRFDY